MKRLICVLLAVLCCGANAAQAAVNFDFDSDGTGPGGVEVVSAFDWKVGNALAVGGNAAAAAFLASGGAVQLPFNVYYQASLAALLDENGDPLFTSVTTGLDQLTIVAAFTEVVTSVSFVPGGLNATFDLAPVQTANYLQIYWDNTPDANDLTGIGFNNTFDPPGPPVGVSVPDPNAKLILDAKVTDIIASNFQATTPIRNLDSFGGDNYPAIDSVTGAGATSLSANISFFDTDFFTAFTTIPGDIRLTLFNSSQILPFNQTNPSARFLTGSTITAAGISPVLAGAGLGVASLGPINGALPGPGGGGPDVQFQVDGSSALEAVPEPGSFVLFSVAAAGFCLARLRGRRAG